MQKLGQQLSQGQKVYETAMTKLQGNQGVIKSAAKLETLGLKYQKSLQNGINEEENLLGVSKNL
jgi:DNA anti-recombination protein RmuC